MAKRIKRTQIIDAHSGELLEDTRHTVYISENYIAGKGYRLYARKGIRLGKWRPLPEMRLQDLGWLYTVILSIDEGNRVGPVEAIAKVQGVTARRVYQVLARLSRFGTVAKVSGGYVLNPAVAFAGIYLAPDLYRLFQKDMDRIIPGRIKVEYGKEET